MARGTAAAGRERAAMLNYLPRMRIRFAACLLALVSTAACHRSPPKEPMLGQVLPNIPLPPHAQPLVREGGVDAIQFVIVSSDPPDSVANYYRNLLSRDPFRLVNERSKGGGTQFYAEQDGPSLWITVSPNGSAGSQITIAGASDSAARKGKP
ncbi:MAG: hypothetical protein ACREL5_11800 [Gemmatimonadales bacterium]